MTPALGESIRKVACSIGSHHAARTIHRNELLIVMYHGVTGSPSVAKRWWHHVAIADFERQLRYLAAHYDVRPIDEALETLWTSGLERPTACVTFDDGYRNNYTVAYPVLEKLHVPATVYIATGMIGTTRRLWTVELDHAFTVTDRASIDLGILGMGKVRLHGEDHRTLFKQVLNGVKEISHRDRPAVLETLFEQLDATDDPVVYEPFSMMTWEEARRLSATGLVTLGGHTVNHEIVSRLDDEDVRTEIIDSIKTVARHATGVSRTFAYPNGSPNDFDDRAVDAVRAAGCVGAVTTIEGLCKPATDPFRLRRIGIGSDTSFDQFRLLTSGLITDVKLWRNASG